MKTSTDGGALEGAQMGVLVDFLKVREHRQGALRNFAYALNEEPHYRDILIGFGSRLLDRAATLSRGEDANDWASRAQQVGPALRSEGDY